MGIHEHGKLSGLYILLACKLIENYPEFSNYYTLRRHIEVGHRVYYFHMITTTYS